MWDTLGPLGYFWLPIQAVAPEIRRASWLRVLTAALDGSWLPLLAAPGYFWLTPGFASLLSLRWLIAVFNAWLN